jgi:hypothetical protein
LVLVYAPHAGAERKNVLSEGKEAEIPTWTFIERKEPSSQGKDNRPQAEDPEERIPEMEAIPKIAQSSLV